MAPRFLFIPFLTRRRGISASALRWSDTPLFPAPRLTRYLPHRDRPYLLHDPRVSLLRCYLSCCLTDSLDRQMGRHPYGSCLLLYICSLPFFSSLRRIFNFLSILASDYIPAIYAFYTRAAGRRVIGSGDWTGLLVVSICSSLDLPRASINHPYSPLPFLTSDGDIGGMLWCEAVPCCRILGPMLGSHEMVLKTTRVRYGDAVTDVRTQILMSKQIHSGAKLNIQ